MDPFLRLSYQTSLLPCCSTCRTHYLFRIEESQPSSRHRILYLVHDHLNLVVVEFHLGVLLHLCCVLLRLNHRAGRTDVRAESPRRWTTGDQRDHRPATTTRNDAARHVTTARHDAAS